MSLPTFTLQKLIAFLGIYFLFTPHSYSQDTSQFQNNTEDSVIIANQTILPDSTKILSPSNPFIITPDSVMVFSYHDFKIFHRVDKKGLKPNDVIRIQFPPIWLPPQDTNILTNNFVSVSSARYGEQPVFEFSAKSRAPVSGVQNNQTYTSFFKMLNAEFTEGDTIVFTYGSKKQGGKGQITSYLSGTDYIYSVIDYSDGSVSGISEMKVKKKPLKPHTIKVYAPSNPVINSSFELKVLVLDKYNNLVYNYSGTLEFSNRDGWVHLPEKYTFLPSDSGKKLFSIFIKDSSVHRIRVKDNSQLTGLCNPIIAVKPGDTKIWWGDMHSHSIYSNHGAGTPEELFYYGKNITCLDFLVYSEHSYIHDSLYRKGIKVSNHYNKENEFVTLNGYEWSTSIEHKVVFFKEENPPPIFRNQSAQRLYLSVYATGGSIIAAHPTSYLYYTNWDTHDPLTQKNSEITGLGGYQYELPSELTPGSSVQEALARGYNLGFIGSSDNHHSRPGKNMSNFLKKPEVGITAAYANQLTRNDIYNAINQRYNYATTGARIVLDFKINNNRMGTVFYMKEKYPLLVGNMYAQDSIESIEILKNNLVLKEYKPSGLDFSFFLEDTLFNSDSYYYVRVIQKNKQLAWSSPIWVNRPITVAERNEIYGKDFFNNQQIGYFQKTSDIKVSENYPLNSGDKINVSIHGSMDYNEVLLLAEDGSIQTKETGKIVLKNIRFAEARALLKNKFESALHLKNSEFTMTLVKARVITIHLTGEVKNPGSYSFPAVNTAFNMLSAAGGINPIGSVRNIQVIRKNKIIRTLDVYDFLRNPDNNQLFFLNENDYLKIPPCEKMVKISGKIRRPGFYELKKTENLNELIAHAGSFEPHAYTGKLLLERLGTDKMVLLDIPYEGLPENSKNFPLKDGDKILVQKIPEGADNFVEIEGAVKLPGKYPLENNARISDLITRAEGVRKDFYPHEGYIVRFKEDLSFEMIAFSPEEIMKNSTSEKNLLLSEGDKVHVFSKNDFLNEFAIELSGAVHQPDNYLFTAGMTLKDLMLNAGGFLESAYLKKGYVFRLKEDMKREYIPITFDTTNHFASLDLFKLKRGDRIRVFSKDYFLDSDSVRISGAVRAPGTYYYSEEMTLEDIIFLSGGLKKEATNMLIEVARMTFFDKQKSVKGEPVIVLKTKAGSNPELDSTASDFRLYPNDHVLVRKDPDFEYPEKVMLKGEVYYPGLYTLKSKNEKLTELIKRAGGLTSVAYAEGASLSRPGVQNGIVSLNLKKAITKPESNFNYIMKEGDTITIPRINELVMIKGAVKTPLTDSVNGINTPFYKGKRAGYYIRKFTSGFESSALKSKVYVLYPDKSIHQTLNLGIVNVYPKVVMGSVIWVP